MTDEVVPANVPGSELIRPTPANDDETMSIVAAPWALQRVWWPRTRGGYGYAGPIPALLVDRRGRWGRLIVAGRNGIACLTRGQFTSLERRIEFCLCDALPLERVQELLKRADRDRKA